MLLQQCHTSVTRGSLSQWDEGCCSSVAVTHEHMLHIHDITEAITQLQHHMMDSLVSVISEQQQAEFFIFRG